jgi:hypothetical protein
VRLLLAAHRPGLLAVGVPEAGLLHEPLAGGDRPHLSPELVDDGPLDVAEGVHVLDLDLGAERGGAHAADRNVRVAAEAAFLHVAVADLEVLQGRPQRAQVRPRLRGAAHVGLTHDLEQGDAAAVEIDQAAAPVGVVDVLARVLLHVDAGQPDAPGLAVDDDLDLAARADRLLVHADLVALRQVRVEVVLAGEARTRRDAASGGQPGADRELDDAAVQHRQHARHAEAHRADVDVGRCTERGRAAAEDLRAGEQLGMHLEADHRLEPVLRPRHGSGLRRCQSLACS